jgi:uncharacterized protein involved in high-affinity Fe2+ transport
MTPIIKARADAVLQSYIRGWLELVGVSAVHAGDGVWYANAISIGSGLGRKTLTFGIGNSQASAMEAALDKVGAPRKST